MQLPACTIISNQLHKAESRPRVHSRDALPEILTFDLERIRPGKVLVQQNYPTPVDHAVSLACDCCAQFDVPPEFFVCTAAPGSSGGRAQFFAASSVLGQMFGREPQNSFTARALKTPQIPWINIFPSSVTIMFFLRPGKL